MKYYLSLLMVTIFWNTYSYAQFYSSEIDTYTSFLEKQNETAKDYVLKLFEKHDVVVLCERNHGEMTQYDLIYDIVKSEYFQEYVGNVFTEVGTVDNRARVENFIHTNYTSDVVKTAEQLDMYRGMVYGLWDKTNYYNFIGKLNTLNNTLSQDRRINLYVSNVRNPSEEETTSIDKFKKYFNAVWGAGRDSIMAQNIITTFDTIKLQSTRKKALVIMNYRHAFSKSLSTDGYINTGDYLKRHYQDKFANVLINGLALIPEVDKKSINKPKVFQDMTQTLVQEGKWDAAFKVLEKDSIGFTFNDSPFGKDNFDLWLYTNDYEYQDIFTGYVYYLPIENHWESEGVENITKGYEEDIYKKNSLLMKALGISPYDINEISKSSNIKNKKYDDLDKLILMREQWLKSDTNGY